MVRVHVRPPPSSIGQPLGLALDLWQRTGKEVRDRPFGAGIPGPPAKHRERPPRGFAPRRGRKLISP